jgi:hypothetical protein
VTSVEERLWDGIVEEARHFGYVPSYNSDLFQLLACILAYYKVRGTTPEKMIGAVHAGKN